MFFYVQIQFVDITNTKHSYVMNLKNAPQTQSERRRGDTKSVSRLLHEEKETILRGVIEMN